MEGRTTTTASPSEEHLRAAPGSSNSGEQALPSAGEKRKCPPKGGPEEDDDDEEDEEDEEDDGNEPFPVEAVETPGGSRYGVRRVLVPDFPSGGRLEEERRRRVRALGLAMVAPSDSPSY